MTRLRFTALGIDKVAPAIGASHAVELESFSDIPLPVRQINDAATLVDQGRCSRYSDLTI